ncbi:MAG: PRC-barrel domain-containing protein [Ferrovibrio sp.]
MKRNFAAVSAVALLLSLPGLVVAQDVGKSKTKSDTIVPIPGTGTAEVKGARLIGADVVNSVSDKLGNVDEVLVTTDGRVNAVVVAMGGMLGLGERKVVVPWERLRFSSQGNDLVVKTDISRETLNAMPEYSDPSRASSDQRQSARPAPAEQGSLPGPLDTSRPIRPAPPTN